MREFFGEKEIKRNREIDSEREGREQQ